VPLVYLPPAPRLASWGLEEKNRHTPLGELMCAEIPELSDGETQDLDVTTAVRNWVSRKMLVSFDDKETYGPINHWEIHPLVKFEEMKEGKFGYKCGGFATALHDVYLKLGLKSKILNFGKPGVFTHVVNLVQVNQKWVIQDPYYSTLIVDLKGRAVSLCRVRFELVLGTASRNLRYQSSVLTRKWIISSLSENVGLGKSKWLPGASEDHSCILAGSGKYICSGENYAFDKVNLDVNAILFLRRKKRPEKLMELMAWEIRG